jgi:VWFA-related protein
MNTLARCDPARFIRPPLIAVVLLAAAIPLSAQTRPAVSEVLDVRITNVEVIVTDLQGRPIRGLTRDDFEIYEDGKKQEITNFHEVSATSSEARAGSVASTPAAPPPASPVPPPVVKKFIFYFDHTTLDPTNRNEVAKSVKTFVRANARGGDQFMVATWSGKFEVRLPWTSDVDALDRALDVIAREGGMASAREANRKLVTGQIDAMVLDEEIALATPGSQGPQHTFDMLMASARNYGESVRNDLVRAAEALARLMISLAGADGRKMLVLTTEALPAQPGAELFHHLDNVRQKVMMNPRSAIGETARRIQPLAEIARLDSSKVLSALGKTANAAGVTIYALKPRAPEAADDSAGGVLDHRAREGNVQFAQSAQTYDGLQILANETGGLAIVGAPAPVAFTAIEQDLGSYYSIGYRARSGPSQERSIEVKGIRPGMRIRTRKSVVYRSIESEMADRVIANQLQPQPDNQLGIELGHDAPRADGSKRVVPLKVMIPVSNLTLLPDGEMVAGGFSVFICTGDGKGDVSGVNMQTHQIRWPKDAVTHLRGKNFTFAVDVPIEGSRTQISVGVVDHLSQTSGFSRLAIP